MKITLLAIQSEKVVGGKLRNNVAKRAKNESTNDDIKYLSSFNTIGQSIVFKANPIIKTSKTEMVIGESASKIIAEIKTLKTIIEELKKPKAIDKPQYIKDAEQIIFKYEYWNANSSNMWDNAQNAANKARDEHNNKCSFWNYAFTNDGYKKFNQVMEEKYYSNKRYYDVGYSAYSAAKEKIDAHVKSQNVSNEERLKLLKTNEEKLALLETNLRFASTRDALNQAMNNVGGLNDRIAGYEDVKRTIENSFISPLIESIENNNNTNRVPAAVMLYGATGCGKTSMLDAIRFQCKDYAVVEDFSGADKKSFLKLLDFSLTKAKDRYKDEHKRTILLINEAEAYMAMEAEDIDTSGILLDKNDVKKLEQYNSLGDCTEIINMLKSKLDYISKIPTDDCPEGCATTIFITSNYPHLIHRDLLSRDGQFGKLMKIAVKPAEDYDLRAVLKYYFAKMSDLIENIKYYATLEKPEELINNMPGISAQGKDVLNKKIKDGTINNMKIDAELGGFKNIDKFIKGNNPSLTKGAYSNARLENIIKQAFVEYLANPSVSYETHFFEVKDRTGRDLMPSAYRQFVNIYKMVENPEKFKNSYMEDISAELTQLIKKLENGEIDDKELQNLKVGIEGIKERYNEFKQIESPTKSVKAIMDKYKRFLDEVKTLDLSEY